MTEDFAKFQDTDTGTVTPEFAEQEFTRFAELMDLDIDISDMDADDLKEFATQKKRLTEAFVSGALTLNDTGELTFTPQRSDDKNPITFYEPTGASIMSMDKRKKNEDIGKMLVLMGSMTRTNAAVFSRMKHGDLKVCQAITAFFLG